MFKKILFSLFLIFIAVSLSADVVFDQVTKISGIPGMGGMEMYSTTYIKGDKQRTDITTKMATGIPGMPGGGEGMMTTMIIDLKKDVMRTLMPDSKTYSEMSLKKMREMMKEFGKEAGDESPEIPVPEIDVKKTKKSKVINGFKCNQVVIEMKSKMTDPETGEKATATFTLDLWLTEKMAGRKEVESFSAKLTEAMTGEKVEGMDFSQLFSNLKNILPGQYGKAGEEMGKKMKDVKGYPILTTFKIEIGGKEEPFTLSSSTEIKSVKVKSVPDSKFKIPEGYTKMTMPGMPGM